MKKFKKSAILTTALCIVCALLVPIFAIAATDVSPQAQALVVSDAQANPGENVTFAITLQNNPGINYIRIKLAYDRDIMTLVSAENKGLLSGTNYLGSKDYTVNPYVLSWTAAGNAYENGELALLTVQISENAPAGAYDIQLLELECFNEDDEIVDLEIFAGTITVAGDTEPTPETTTEAPTSETTTEEPATETTTDAEENSETPPYVEHSTDNCVVELPYTLGDVDNDGHITAADARIALRISSRLEVNFTDSQKMAADIDGDGYITAEDAGKILRISAKLDSIENYK